MEYLMKQSLIGHLTALAQNTSWEKVRLLVIVAESLTGYKGESVLADCDEAAQLIPQEGDA